MDPLKQALRLPRALITSRLLSLPCSAELRDSRTRITNLARLGSKLKKNRSIFTRRSDSTLSLTQDGGLGTFIGQTRSASAKSVTGSHGPSGNTNSQSGESTLSGDQWEVKMLYDGDCPLCMREVNMLRERNKKYGTIKFVDIAASDYDPEANAGIDFESAMGRIHGIQRDGQVLTNIVAFRKFYEAVGLGWVYAITKSPVILQVADAVYDFWAKYRLPITGRPALATILEERRQKNLMKHFSDTSSATQGGRCRLEQD